MRKAMERMEKAEMAKQAAIKRAKKAKQAHIRAQKAALREQYESAQGYRSHSSSASSSEFAAPTVSRDGRSHKKKPEHKSQLKSQQAAANPHMSAWRQALQERGLTLPGQPFAKIPSKGTPEYELLKARQREIELGGM
jgi:hypothetical protein